MINKIIPYFGRRRVGAGESLLLNIYGGAKTAYSLEYISTSFVGNDVITVRRNSDNAKLGFTPTEITDGTLATWVGVGNSGFIQTWFDQSGNAINLETLDTANQPSIVVSGILNVDNGNPYIGYSGNSNSFNGLRAIMGLTSATGSVFGTYNSADPTNGMVLGSHNNSVFIGALFNGDTASPDNLAGTPTYYNNGLLISPANRNTLYDNYVVSQDVLMTILNCGFSSSAIWNTSFTTPYLYPNFTISHNVKAKEFIIYDSDQTSNRVGIEDNINNRYSIY